MTEYNVTITMMQITFLTINIKGTGFTIKRNLLTIRTDYIVNKNYLFSFQIQKQS